MSDDNTDHALLLIEPLPASGAWNMAVDEALLEAAREQQLVALRFYRWQEPTLSLGYFQKQLPDNLPTELNELPAVRRLSGGGAILHHHEWTYSCVIPLDHFLTNEPGQLYDHVHEVIVSFLNEQGIPAALRRELQGEFPSEPFLCFGRQDPRDIVMGASKILGSAQRRRRGAVLQHGSLLIKRSPYAPEYAGISDLLPNRHFPFDDWIPELAQQTARILLPNRLGEIPTQTELPADINQLAKRLESESYQLMNSPKPV